MKLVSVETPEKSVCKMTFSASPEELEAASNAVYERTRASYTIRGFKKGEADRAQIEADRGEHTFWYDAINDLMDKDVPALYDAAMAEHGFVAVDNPVYDLVSVKKDEGFVATATVALQPELNLTKTTGFTAECVTPEVTDKEIDTAVGEYGGLDVLICNAGLSMRALFDDVDLEVLHRLMDVNFWGTVYCTKYALPYLQASHGSLVGISSVAGLHGLPGRTGYSASKYAMTGFLETVRIENLKKGLHVMVACPGFTASNVRFSALTADGSSQGETPRDEAKMMTPEQVARIVIRGIEKRKRLCLMEAEGRATHFIKKFAPGFLDRMFYMVMAREPDSPLK